MKSDVKTGFFNIGTGIATSIKNLADLIIRLSGKSLKPVYDKLPDGDVKLSQADISLAKKFFSWEPKTTLEEGLSKFFNN